MNYDAKRPWILKPEIFFLVASLLFGSLFISISPPFQVPDSHVHFYRAYQVSEGGLIAEKTDNRVGGNLPSSLLKLTTYYLPTHLPPELSKEILPAKGSQIPLEKDKRMFTDFNSSALYPAFCYLPQAFAMFVLRLCNCGPLILFYGASILALIFWSLLVFLAIRIIPLGKWLMTFVALLPMSVYINASVSADCVTNSLAFLFLALILNTVFQKEQMSKRRFFLIGLFLVLITQVKPGFVWLSLLVLMIPASNYGGRKKQLIILILFFIITAVPYVLWMDVMKKDYLSYEQYNPEYRDHVALVKGADGNKQLDNINENKSIIFKVLTHSFVEFPAYHIPGYVATFGWLTIVPPAWFTYTIFLFILLIAVFENNDGLKIKWWMKPAFVLIFLITLSNIFMALFLSWQPLDGPKGVDFIQGRYLAPIYPLVFFCISSIYPTRRNIVPLLATVVTILSLGYCCVLIYQAYP